ncbi:MAG: molybdenum cofactor guanylyltransferase [Clostridiales bacterium]|nr:molybdenum cofactor guanylyltransferase [Clostridiales bacterium]
MEYFGEAVILCGGKSRRMDFDKSFVKIHGRYMMEIIYEKLSHCFNRVKLCADSQERLSVFGLEIIEDIVKDRIGPSAGIYSALSQAATKYVFVAACDMPLINIAHIQFMQRLLEEHRYLPEALIPQNGEYIEPLYSFYSAGLAKKFAAEIKQGNYKIHDILNKCDVLYFAEKYSKMFDENLAMFTNINYITDLEKLL